MHTHRNKQQQRIDMEVSRERRNDRHRNDRRRGIRRPIRREVNPKDDRKLHRR
jgi:hypothetical protein